MLDRACEPAREAVEKLLATIDVCFIRTTLRHISCDHERLHQ